MQGTERDTANTIQGLKTLIDDCTKSEQTEYINDKLKDKLEIKEFLEFKEVIESEY
jgi:hypothetical protein